MQTKELLFALCSMQGVSGHESPIAKLLQSELEKIAHRVYIDTLGSVHAQFFCGAPDAKKILLDAHMDEIGLMVTRICKDGMLKFCNLGGVDSRILPAARVTVHGKRDLFGVVTTLPPHITSAGDYKKVIPAEEMCIDVGLDFETVSSLISPGDVIHFESPPKELSNGCISSKSLDDRAGVVCLLLAIEQVKDKLKQIDIELQFSVQEEHNLGGARTGAYRAKADLCICVDVGHASTPDSSKDNTYELDGGVMIGIAPSLSRQISKTMIALAEQKQIPYQIEVMGGSSGTNAWAIDILHGGTPCGLLSIPLRYMHTSNEVIQWNDVQSTADLLAQFLLQADSEGAI